MVNNVNKQYILFQQVLIVLTDHRTCTRNKKEKVKERVEEIRKLPVDKLLPIAIGRHINIRELQDLQHRIKVPMFGEYEDAKKIATKILHGAYNMQVHCIIIASNIKDTATVLAKLFLQ